MGKERTKVNPDRQRQRYNREFKLEAVRQALPRVGPRDLHQPEEPDH